MMVKSPWGISALVRGWGRDDENGLNLVRLRAWGHLEKSGRQLESGLVTSWELEGCIQVIESNK